jgi:hypothetical protein
MTPTEKFGWKKLNERNPYQPPKSNPKRTTDRWNEKVDPRKELLDWPTFFFIFIWLVIFFFHRLLYDFFVAIFKNLMYN